MPSGLSVLVVEKAVSMICLRLDRFARPGIQPSLAHEPKATMNFDLRRSILARWTVSSVRMLPETRVIVISPSAIDSMSAYLPSIIVGHRTMSKAAATSTMCSWMFTIAMSQPGVAGGPSASPPVASQAVSRLKASRSTMLPAGQLSGPSARTSSVTRAISLARRTPSAALAQTSWRRAGSMPSASIVRARSWKRRRAL